MKTAVIAAIAIGLALYLQAILTDNSVKLTSIIAGAVLAGFVGYWIEKRRAAK